MKDFNELLTLLKEKDEQKLVLSGAEDIEALKAVKEASDMGIISSILVGNPEVIKKNCEEVELTNYEIVSAASEEETAEKSVKLISSGSGTVLMKGMIKTAKLLKATLNKEWGLRTGRLLSHVAVASTPVLKKMIAITDGGMNLLPTLEEKIDIITNAVELMKTLGVDTPKVAPIAAVEVVNPKMPPTVDAAILSKMNSRGQIKGCIIDGPLGLDNALSEFAASIKKIPGDVAGNADILLVPDIHSGNFLGKSVEYIGGGTIGGLIMGAQVPIVIVSRADKAEAKLASIALGVVNSVNHK
ncbi:MAG TPA: bifunctional enoyl-CoA hydratase/phosphate acetyltransferase [Thermotogota bacterium]|nr:bifunctional enoyl-CoA hydratase/phosphate acetyltransferase [Thermotogota bacterium]HPJ87696.1 bifunctional enoyl-CoA hydratase/phosphate acetyltransferase [Thermotogota bacterium]HPR94865.1 bifunctional enoyl-CoA hydratase/phosphate acetyltransferase [Thermotogota bacterium]